MGKSNAQEFVGWKSGSLEVIGIKGKDRHGIIIYNVKCHTCAKDVELFGNGIFNAPKMALIKGIKPCGCAVSPRWTEQQYLIKTRRIGEGRFTVLGYNEQFISQKTKINLKCDICENKWTTSLINILSGKGCPDCGRDRIRKSNYKADDFIGWKSPDNTLEVLSVNSKIRSTTIFNVKCHTCAKDVELFGNGIFTARKSSLLLGEKPCGCAANSRWTEQQWLIRARRISEGKFNVIGFTDTYKNYSSRINMVCNVCKHKWNATVTKIVNSGTGCPECAKSVSGTYGFYTNRTTEQDNLYVLNFNNEYIKVGRAFDISKRVDRLKNESGIRNITIINTVQDTHENIYKLEQYIHEELRERGFQHELDWSTECFDVDSLTLINKLIN